MRKLFTVLTVIFAQTQVWAAEPLTLDQLKSLVAQSAWNEILEKAETVKPSERNAEWNKAVSLAAPQVLTHQPEEKNPFSEFERAQKLATRFSFLKSDAVFQKRSEEVLVEDLKSCDERKFDDCDARVGKLTKGTSASLLMAAANALLELRYFATSPMLLVADAVKQNLKLCDNKTVLKVTLSSLDLPFDAERAKEARNVAFGVCYKDMAKDLKQEMVGANEYRLKNTCKEMKAKKALSELQNDLCADVGE